MNFYGSTSVINIESLSHSHSLRFFGKKKKIQMKSPLRCERQQQVKLNQKSIDGEKKIPEFLEMKVIFTLFEVDGNESLFNYQRLSLTIINEINQFLPKHWKYFTQWFFSWEKLHGGRGKHNFQSILLMRIFSYSDIVSDVFFWNYCLWFYQNISVFQKN